MMTRMPCAVAGDLRGVSLHGGSPERARGAERVKTAAPDGIFFDLRMPVMDGFRPDLLHRKYRITVIVITASQTGDVVQRVRAQGTWVPLETL
jgi:CheY-like chemotaxis protein